MARRSARRQPTEAGPPPASPGAVSRLLDELARAPPADLDAAWEGVLRRGERVGRFEITCEVGRGGFGLVYEARDVELSRPVAFKVLRPARAGDPAAAESLRREAEAAGQLNHANIVTLHDVGTHRGRPYLIMELLRGETLASRLARGPLPPREALDVAVQVARALAHAHGAGVLHRDLKPSNVFLCRGGVAKVLDFGLARVLGGGSPAGGTPGYMAPEERRREPASARSDVFSAAVMLHESLAGRRPWPDPPDGEPEAEPGPPAPLDVPGVPAALRRLVAGALSADPAVRPRDGQAWLDGLLAARGAPGAGRRAWLAAAAVGAAALAAAALLALRSRPAAGGAPVTVAVADFENATDEKDLSGLSGLLITSLEQSRHLRVLTRSRMLDLAQQAGGAPVERIDERLGREASRRAGARALLLATVRRFDRVYAVELHAIDPVADAYLFTLKEQGTGKGSIPGIIDRLGEATRRALREKAAEVEAARVEVAQAVTGSLEAYQHYFAGVQCIDGLGPVSSCVDHFRAALRADPTFALAHYMIAYTSEFRRAPPGEAQAAIEAALQHIGRAPAKERELILAWSAHVRGKDEEAVATYRRLLERFPADGHAAYVAGDLLHHKGDFAGALPLFERALELGAQIPVLRAHVVEALARLGRAEEGVRRARAWTEAQPDATNQRVLAEALALGGQFQGAVTAARRAVDAGGGAEAQLKLSDLLALAGRYREAEAAARRLAGTDQPPATREMARVRLATALTYQGRRREARGELDAIRGGETVLRGIGAVVWLLGGGPRAVDEALRESERLEEPVRRRAAAVVGIYLALAGQPARARELVQRAGAESDEGWQAVRAFLDGEAEKGLAAARALEVKSGGAPAFVAGMLLAGAGRDREAVEAFRRFQASPSEAVLRCSCYPQSLYHAARSLMRLGDRAGARAELDRLLTAWDRADPDLHLLAEAKALRRSL
ncbi:MAG TPA: protein kinase [Anaeromyxobacteraceae bacterium]